MLERMNGAFGPPDYHLDAPTSATRNGRSVYNRRQIVQRCPESQAICKGASAATGSTKKLRANPYGTALRLNENWPCGNPKPNHDRKK